MGRCFVLCVIYFGNSHSEPLHKQKQKQTEKPPGHQNTTQKPKRQFSHPPKKFPKSKPSCEEIQYHNHGALTYPTLKGGQPNKIGLTPPPHPFFLNCSPPTTAFPAQREIYQSLYLYLYQTKKKGEPPRLSPPSPLCLNINKESIDLQARKTGRRAF